ncbi:MAG: hypothetical protein C4K58_07540 [Flavobacteriaceae bacterium]|nr:MAG: hypothetical protein C4K58_07540 [Flavobacteriaceae bacterium]
MKNLSSIFLMLFLVNFGYGQNDKTYNPILTGAPFLRISPDARAGGLADMGVATSSDAYSQYWNASKYAFAKNTSAIGVSFTPYLSQITNDVYLLNVSGYTFIDQDQRSTLGASLNYFSLGDVELTSLGVDNTYVSNGTAKPSEFSFDVSYGLRLTDYYAMAVALRYIRSDLYNGINDTSNKAASTFAVDLSGMYTTGDILVLGMDSEVRAGYNISNIGPKLDYSNDDQKATYLPSNLRLGSAIDLNFNQNNKLTLALELSKLLVPTPVAGQTPQDNGVLSSVFSSLSDGEDGKEITYAFSSEYLLNDAFAFRAGYFYENEDKGARQYLATGLGLKYDAFGFDASYLFSTNSNVNNALQNTLRLGLTWYIGEEVR